MNQSNNQVCIDACNKLLRGELSAIETYNQAIEKFDSPGDRSVLHEILTDHAHNAEVLREHVISMGGKPSDDSGVWGNFAQAITGTAKVLGESSALEALRAGEKHGIREYKDALEDDDVMPEIKGRISEDLLPILGEHIQKLGRLAA